TTAGVPASQCAIAFVNVTVAAVNDLPSAGDDSAQTNEDTPVDVTVLTNDSDIDGDTLHVTSVTQGAHGSVVNNSDVLRYTPAANFNGSDSFTYTISDGHGGEATGHVTVTVVAVNDNPVAVNDSASTNEDTPVDIDVVANDSDVDGDTLSLFSVGTAAHGSVTIVSGKARYSPAANNGGDGFTYMVSDGHGGQATGNGPAHGTLSGSGANRTYTLAADYCGADSFTFTVQDGGDGSAPPLTSNPATVS